MQKRGAIIDCDDFSALRNTYPEHPISKIVPNVKTFEELKEQRFKSKRKSIDDNNAVFDNHYKKFQEFQDKPHVLSEFYKGNQRFSSVNQRREHDRQ